MSKNFNTDNITKIINNSTAKNTLNQDYIKVILPNNP